VRRDSGSPAPPSVLSAGRTHPSDRYMAPAATNELYTVTVGGPMTPIALVTRSTLGIPRRILELVCGFPLVDDNELLRRKASHRLGVLGAGPTL
jgi:hypothetical protein